MPVDRPRRRHPARGGDRDHDQPLPEVARAMSAVPSIRARLLFRAAALAGLAAGCAAVPPGGGGAAPAPSCRTGAAVAWIVTAGQDAAALERWCAAVGGPLLRPAGGTTDRPVDSLVVVSWNVKVGDAAVERFAADLRAGRHTGGHPVADFVLLVQEAYRAGDGVPAGAAGMAGPRRQAKARPAEAGDIAALAERLGLHLFYVPSMRNGHPADGGPAEDRGNAILSTLPLAEPTAVELGFERQRRVAASAVVSGRTAAGTPWRLQVLSAHLDTGGRSLPTSPAARRNQARALADALPGGGAVVLGADLNTHFGAREPAVALLRELLPLPHTLPPGRTYQILTPIARLDYLLFRLPPGGTGGYHVLSDPYGSDHRPLLATVRLAPPLTAAVLP
jgi:endonuclease/exonuclease/phosphatase family metal-dependent hydrolase